MATGATRRSPKPRQIGRSRLLAPVFCSAATNAPVPGGRPPCPPHPSPGCQNWGSGPRYRPACRPGGMPRKPRPLRTCTAAPTSPRCRHRPLRVIRAPCRPCARPNLRCCQCGRWRLTCHVPGPLLLPEVAEFATRGSNGGVILPRMIGTRSTLRRESSAQHAVKLLAPGPRGMALMARRRPGTSQSRPTVPALFTAAAGLGQPCQGQRDHQSPAPPPRGPHHDHPAPGRQLDVGSMRVDTANVTPGAVATFAAVEARLIGVGGDRVSACSRRPSSHPHSHGCAGYDSDRC
jgi:hypothetical protein